VHSTHYTSAAAIFKAAAYAHLTHNVFHVTVVSPYVEIEEYRVNFTEPPPDLINRELKWEVEKILGSR
jgi:hypothetical protein